MSGDIGMKPGIIYTVIRAEREVRLEWEVRVWRRAALTSLGLTALAVVPVLGMTWLYRGCW